MSYSVVILAGGESTGTRFRPLSISSPKTLYPIAGKPLLTHIIDALMDQLSDVVVDISLLGFFKDQSVFERYVLEMSTKYPEVRFAYYSESNSKGTAGGLYQFKSKLLIHDGLIFIHGDIICDFPFRDLLKFHTMKKSDATILGVDPLTLALNLKQYLSVVADDPETLEKASILSNFGTILSKKGTSDVVHYVEKPSTDFVSVQSHNHYEVLINGGVYFFKSSAIVSLLEEAVSSKASAPTRDDSLSLELDVLRNLPQLQYEFNAFKCGGFWYHLKTPLSALLANSFFLRKYGKDVLSSYQFPGARLGANVTIGKNVNIGKGVRIRNAIIGDNVTIGDNTLVSNAIISNNVTIGAWCRIEGSITNSTICKDIVHTHSDGLIKYINSLVVLCENTKVLKDKFVFNSIVLPHKELNHDTKYEIVM